MLMLAGQYPYIKKSHAKITSKFVAYLFLIKYATFGIVLAK